MGVLHRTSRRRAAGLVSAALLFSVLPATAGFADTVDERIEAACPSTAVPDSGFADSVGVHSAGIECLAWYELAFGKTAEEFGTEDLLTRGQASSLIVRFIDSVEDVELPAEPATGVFPDVVAGDTHTEAIETLAAFQPPILEGLEGGTFAPGATITRQQFASIIARMYDVLADQTDLDPLPEAELEGFEDVDPDNVHADNIARLAAAAIMIGPAPDRFEPGREVFRGQSATVLARLLGSFVETGLVPVPEAVFALTGVVSDASTVSPGTVGTPLAGAEVAISAGAAPGGQPLGTTVSAADGTFSFTVRAGIYRLSAVQEVGGQSFTGPATVVQVSDDATADIGLFPLSQVTPPVDPDEIEITSTTSADVSVEGGFWVIPLLTDDGATQLSPTDADDIVMQWPDGLLLALDAAGTDASYWSRAGCAGLPGGFFYAEGDYVVSYRFDQQWVQLTVTFDDASCLAAVNGDEYVPAS